MTRFGRDTGITVTRNAMVLLSSSFVAHFLLLGFNIVLARSLGVQQFGVYAFAISYVTLLSILVEFALPRLTIRDVARDPELAGSYFSNTLALKVLFFLLAIVIVPITTELLGYSRQIQTVLYVLSIGLLFDALLNCCIALFNALQEMRYSGALQITEEFCFLLFGLASLGLGGGIIAIVACRVAAQAVAALAGVLLVTTKLHILPGRLSYTFCKQLIRKARHFFGVSVFTQATHTLDTVLLLSLQGAVAAGIYAAAAKLMKVTTYFSKAFCDALYPVISRQATLSDKTLLTTTYCQSVKWLIIAIVPFVVFATAQSERIMLTLYGSDFVEASFVFQILAWRAAVGFFTQFCGTVLYGLGLQRIVFNATGASATINIILYAALIPLYSYTGAAVATLVALLIEFVLQLSAVFMSLNVASIRAAVVKPVAAGIGMVAVCIFFDFMPVIPLAGVALAIYGICLIIFGAISRVEVQILLTSLATVVAKENNSRRA